MVAEHLPHDTMLRCAHCNHCAPEKFCNYSHWFYDSGPDESMFSCPACDETNFRAGDDDDRCAFPDKNVIVVALKWRGKRFYRKHLSEATIIPFETLQ